MINKNTVSALLHAVLRKKKVHTYSKQTMYPRRDWLIGIFVFSVIVLLGGGYTLYIFNVYQNMHTSVTADVQPLEGYKEHTVAKVLTLYREKKALFGAKLTITNESVGLDEITPPEGFQATTTSEVLVASTTSSAELIQVSSSTDDVTLVETPILE